MQPSQAIPGRMSITSASLDDLDPPVSGKDAFREAVFLIKQPLPIWQPIMKNAEVTEDANTINVKFTLDGKALDGYGFGKGDGTDKIVSFKKVIVDESKLMLTIDELVDPVNGAFVGSPEASGDKKFSSTTCKLLTSPTRIEFTVSNHQESPEFGANPSEGPMVDALYPWSDTIISNLQSEATAQIKFSVGDSIQEPGKKSVVSTSMEDVVGYDAFMDAWIASAKKLFGSIPDASMEDISETEFKVTAGELNIHAKFDRDTGTFVAKNSTKEQIQNTVYRVLHKDVKTGGGYGGAAAGSKMVMEAWDVLGSGERIASDATVRMVRKNMNDVVKAATSWW